MRLIDADELKKCVLKWLPQDPCGREEKEFPFETDICVSMLMEIDEQPTITPESHWIPVTERPPEEDGRYLVCGAKGGIYHANYRGRWWTQVGCGGKLVPSVVAWMPLPEPYKGVTE